jgi:DNA-binding NtrC family response regulator
MANVLLVDDDDMMRSCVKRCIERLGHHVFEATTLAEAKVVLAGNPHIDAAVSDLEIGTSGTGAELYDYINGKIPFMLISATNEILLREHRVVKSGKCAYWHKGGDLASLHQGLEQFLSGLSDTAPVAKEPTREGVQRRIPLGSPN